MLKWWKNDGGKPEPACCFWYEFTWRFKVANYLVKSRRFRRWRWVQSEDEFGQFGEPIALKLMWWGL